MYKRNLLPLGIVALVAACDADPVAPGARAPVSASVAAGSQWAIADTGARLRVEWGLEFRGLVGPPPTVVDGEGVMVVREGTAGAMPDGAWPSLGGHFVCPGPETLYVFNEPLPG